MIWKAERIATQIHQGQIRKDGKTPYIEHPKEVARLLEGIGITDSDIICAAWLHDTIEKGNITQEFIEKEFNLEVARIVQVLSRNVSREEYNKRIKNADYAVKIVKLADTIHNCSTLHNKMPEKAIQNKLNDCKEIYLDVAREICPEFYNTLLESIKPWDKENVIILAKKQKS